VEAQSIRWPDPSAPLRFGRDDPAFYFFDFLNAGSFFAHILRARLHYIIGADISKSFDLADVR